MLRLSTVAILAAVAVSWAAASVIPDLELDHELFTDFRLNVWEPGRAILDGRGPLLDETGRGEHGTVYPPASALTTLPFALPPYHVAVALWLLTLLVSVPLALRVCGVRDLRCIALAVASPPVVTGLAYANVSLLLVLALAGTWAWRDRPWRAGALLGISIAGKLFVWPLLFWLLLTGRRRAAAITVASGLVATFLGWAVVAFRRVDEFVEVTRRNASGFDDDGVSVASVAANLGASTETASIVALAAGAIALLVAARQRKDDASCLSWSVAAVLLASPIVWNHYYALMFVPLALAAPTLSRAWLMPYLTAPQMTVATTPGGRIFDAATGVLFVVMAASHRDRQDSKRVLLPERGRHLGSRATAGRPEAN